MGNLPKKSKPKGRFQLKYRGTKCINCGHSLDISDRFCPHCSQANSTKKLTLKDFFEEFFSSLISYDSKLLKTLSALLLRPGQITKDYVRGKRVSYTNPFRFLLSLSIVYFLMLNFNDNLGLTKLDKYGSDEKSQFKLRDGSLDFGNDNDQWYSKIDSATHAGIDSLPLNQVLSKRDSVVLSNPKEYLHNLDSLPLFARFGAKREVFGILIKENDQLDFNEIIKKYDLNNSKTHEYAYHAAQSFRRFMQRPGTFVASLISKLPFLIFFLIPVFALFIWMVYIRKKYTYTDHLVFGFHIQSLLFILLIISFLIDSIFDIFSGWFFILVFIVYLYKSMRNFYRQGRLKTILKFAFLNMIFIILTMLSVGILLTGSIYTY